MTNKLAMIMLASKLPYSSCCSLHELSLLHYQDAFTAFRALKSAGGVPALKGKIKV